MNSERISRLPDQYFAVPNWLYLLPRSVSMLLIATFVLGIYFWPGHKPIPVRLIFVLSSIVVALVIIGTCGGFILLLLHVARVL